MRKRLNLFLMLLFLCASLTVGLGYFGILTSEPQREVASVPAVTPQSGAPAIEPKATTPPEVTAKEQLLITQNSPVANSVVKVKAGDTFDVKFDWRITGEFDRASLSIERAGSRFAKAVTKIDILNRKTYALRFRAAGSYAWTIDAEDTRTGAKASVKNKFILEQDMPPPPPPVVVARTINPESTNETPAGQVELPPSLANSPTIAPPTIPSALSAPLQPVALSSPPPNAKIEALDDEATPVRLRWEPREKVDHYNVYVYDAQGKLRLRQSTEQDTLKILLPHDQTYRWLVVSMPKGQIEGLPPPVPADAPSFELGKYRKLALSRAEEPAAVYAWGRYMLSYAEFTGDNFDVNARTKQRLYEGAGELAAGFWSRETHLGVLAHAQISGFWMENELHPRNYVDAGVDIGFRQILDNGGRVRLWVGPAMHEAPEIIRNALTEGSTFQRVRTFGPQMQLAYSQELRRYPNYGWNMYGILYHPLTDGGTPNDRPYVPLDSFTLGASITFRDGEKKKWMYGYSYREENLRYQSSDRSGRDNRSTLAGHYITLTLEYGLADPIK